MHSAAPDKRATLGEWYQERFQSDPYALLEYFAGDIARIAAQFDIDWDATYSKVRLSTGKGKASKVHGKNLRFLQKKSPYRGRVACYAEEHSVDHGAHKLRIPFISFGAKGHGGESDHWNGYHALRELYEREVDQIISAEERAAIDARLAEKRRRRQERLAQLEAEERAKAQAQRENVERDLKLHHSLAPAAQEVGTAVATPAEEGRFQGGDRGHHPCRPHRYAAKKQILEVLGDANVRIGSDYRGRFLSVLACGIDGTERGLQKIYEEKFQPAQNSAPTDKLFTWGADMDGAHAVIGDLQEALKSGEPIRFVEGFATGGTIRLATGHCVVVCFNAGNLKTVVSLFCRYYPNAPKIIDADNDCWKAAEGKGNAGLLAALEAAKEHPGVKVTFPTFDDMDTDSRPTDWNDVHCLHPHGIKAVQRKLRSAACKLKPESKNFEYRLQRLALVHRDRAQDEALQAVNAGMMLAPFMYSSTEVVKIVEAAMPPAVALPPEKMASLKRRARWLMQQKMRRAQGFRSFTAETLAKPNVTYELVEPVRSVEGHPLLPPKVLRKVQALDGVIIVRSPMASGKTKHLLAPLMRNSRRGAYLAHRVSLIADACNRLAERDERGRIRIRVDNYQDIAAPMVPLVERMGCCINSITHPKFTPFFAAVEDLLIDEASQTLRHVADGTVDNPVLVLDKLAEMMRNADRTVMCDADASDALVEFAEKACPGQAIHIIEMASDCSNIEVLHTTDLMAHQQVIEAAKRGETVLVADDSAKDGAALAQRLRTECAGVQVLHVHKDSKGEEDVEAFLADPNSQASRWQVVIYSPAISSGVSIETPHFRHHVGVFFGAVAPSDAVQMLRRDRTARRYIVGFHLTEHRRETDRERIFRGRVAADRRALVEACGREPDWEETDEEFVARWHKTTFDDVWLTATAAEREARADFANNMLLILHGDGYRVGRLAANPLDEEQAREGKRVAKAAVTAARHELIHSVETPSIEEAQRLMRRDVMSREEAAQLTRYHIETQLCAPLVEQQDIEFWENRGPKRLASFEALRADTATCQAFDNHLAERGVVTTRRLLKTATHLILRQVFDSLGIDIETGAGEFTAQQAQQAMATVLSSEAAIEEYNELPIGPYVHPKSKPKCATSWVKAVLERLGLKVRAARRGKAKKRVHFIDPDSWAQLNDYYLRRQAAGVSSLAIHDEDDEQPSQLPTSTTGSAQVAGEGAIEEPVGGPPSQCVVKELVTKVVHPEGRELPKFFEKYPRAAEIVERVCRGSSVFYREEVAGWLDEGHWADLESGAMSEWSLRCLLEVFERRLQRAGGAA